MAAGCNLSAAFLDVAFNAIPVFVVMINNDDLKLL